MGLMRAALKAEMKAGRMVVKKVQWMVAMRVDSMADPKVGEMES